MSRLATGAEDARPILVIMGRHGTGKSRLANELFSLAPPFAHSDSPTHVTSKQTFRETPGDEYFAGVVDTRGLDSDPNNFPTMHELYGKPVVFVLLNNEYRVKDTIDIMTHRLDISYDNIWVFNAHFCSIKPKKTIPNIAWYHYDEIFQKKSQLSSKKVPEYRPFATLEHLQTAVHNGGVAPGLQMSNQDERMLPLSKNALKKQRKRERNLQFPLCHKIFDRSISFDTSMNLNQIKKHFDDLTQEKKQKNRAEGDALLKMVMARLVTAGEFSSERAQSFQINGHLEKFLNEFLGDSKSLEIAKKVGETTDPSTTPSTESYGDMFEAVLHLTFSALLIEKLLDFSLRPHE